MAFTNNWDEAAPAGTDLISAGDDEIRQFKVDIRQRLNSIVTSATALANNVDPLIILPRVEVSKNSAAAVGDRRTLNLIEGSNITLTITDDSGGDEIDVTIAAAGLTADEVWEHATSDADNAGTFGRVLNEWEDGGRLDLLLDTAQNKAYDPIHTSVTDVVTSTGTTDIVNVTEAGRLLSIAVVVSVDVTGTASVSSIEIVVDGGTTRTISVRASSLTWDFSGLRPYGIFGTLTTGLIGDTKGDSAIIVLGINYKTSLRVSHNITTAAGTAGTDEWSVIRGVEL